MSTIPPKGSPGGASGKEPTCQCRRHKRRRFESWVRKVPWRRKWQPPPVFLPGESHGRRSLAGYSPRGRKESNTTERLSAHPHASPQNILPASLAYRTQRPGPGLGLGVLKTCHSEERRRRKRRKKGVGKGKSENTRHSQSASHPPLRPRWKGRFEPRNEPRRLVLLSSAFCRGGR